MDLAQLLQRLGIAAGLGMLIGLQRQKSGSALAGIRTFTLIAVFGALCALLAERFGAWMPGAGLAAIAAMLVGGHLRRHDEASPGLTTEIAALLVYALGAWVVYGPLAPALVVAGGAAVLLHAKEPMHAFVARIAPNDWRAVMQFVLIALVILPVLPDSPYGPYDVLNPHEIWFMVVLIVGISLSGYLAYQAFGDTAGALVAGAVGGVISSTATTVSFARRVRGDPASAALAALVAMIASTVAVARVVIEVAVVSPASLAALAWPFAVLGTAMAAVCVAMWALSRRAPARLPQHGNPAQLRSALAFGLLYAAVLIAVAATRARFGGGALYAVAVVSGCTDMDAITLSTARLASAGQVDHDTAWRVVLVAALANLAFKGAIGGVLGGRALAWRLAIAFGACVLVGTAVVVFWPASAASAA